MTTTNKGGSIPDSKNRFDVTTKYLFCKLIKVPRLPKVLLMQKEETSAAKQKKLAEILSNMGSQRLLGGPVLPRP